MQADSRHVSSNQPGLHSRLAAAVRKHLDTVHRRPVASHNTAAFTRLGRELAMNPRPLVLDSFCGTGHSTAQLAQRHPDHLVVGIDKSSRRLGRHAGSNDGQYLLLQAECEDIWQLLAQAGLGVDYHYLFYPNPWPKAKHLQRRVHAHPAFPLLLQLGRQAGALAGGHIELRSNWQLYVEEFGVAMHLAGCRGRIERVAGAPAITLFENKYRKSGHDLWAFTGTVGSVPVAP